MPQRLVRLPTPWVPLWLLLAASRAWTAAAAYANRFSNPKWHKHKLTVSPQVTPARTRCGELLKKEHPDEVQCPEACPFLRIEPSYLCQFACVRAEECSVANPLANFADPLTMQCEVCLVTACHQCAGNAQTCKVCQSGFELTDGMCRSEDRHWWHRVYGALAVVVVLLLVYVIVLANRPCDNHPRILEGGLIFRKFSKLLNKKENKNEPYSLTTDLRKKDVAGVGVMLFFDWQFWILLWSIITTAVMAGLACAFDTRPSAIEYPPGDPRSFHACNFDIQRQAKQVAAMKFAYFWAVLILYVVSTAGSLALAVYHKRMGQRIMAEELTMNDFALMAAGLPSDPMAFGSELVEEDLKEALEGLLECRIVGISVCWDMRGVATEVQSQVRAQLDELQKDKARGETRVCKQDTIEADCSPRSEAYRSCCDRQLHCMDAALGFGGPCSSLELEEEDESTEAKKKFLRSLQCSGHAFVVFHSTDDCAKALARSKQEPLELAGRKVVLERKCVEPEEVQWTSFGATYTHAGARIACGCLGVLLTIAALDLCVYTPYVSYLRSSQIINRKPEGGFQEFLLGSLIILANQVIYWVCEKVAVSSSFFFKSTTQTVYVVFYTVAVLINTVADLHTVLIITAGTTFADMIEGSTDKIITIEAVMQNPAVQRTLFGQTATYVYSCLILPFVAEPVLLAVLPYFLNARRLRV